MRPSRATAMLPILLSACVWALVKPGPVSMGAYTVETGSSWSSRSRDNVVFWTVDGTALEMVTFVNGIGDQEPLFQGEWFGLENVDEPLFRSGMDAFDVEQLFADAWTQIGWHAIQTSNLHPNAFGSHEGFRFDVFCSSEAGLEYQGLAAGSIIDGALYLVLYQAPRLHYYEAYLPEVEAVLASIRTDQRLDEP